ncbi:hypothetical protein ACERII_12450 [Evansella sp. AB-rgal1]|uniref:hypothetical protein n=1 Tax=Evansella sp. AB-rgal1 TaxID=3242696 RepID=UPI00359E4AD1
MDELLFLRIIDGVKMYGIQVIGIILIIILSKYFIQIFLWVVSIVVSILLAIIKIIFSIILFILHLMPAVLQEKLNKLIYKTEAGIRGMEIRNGRIKEWFAGAPRAYEKIHRNILKVIQGAFKIFLIVCVVIFIINVFIQRSLNIEQIINHL